MKASQKCIDLIKGFEGFSAKPYRCPAGIPTIGVGSTHYADGTSVTMNDAPISEEIADALLLSTLNAEYVPAVNRYVTAQINQNQFDACVDFCYNAGAQNFRTSTLLKLINSSDFKNAALEFGKWCHGGGQILPGLVTRRAVECKLFSQP